MSSLPNEDLQRQIARLAEALAPAQAQALEAVEGMATQLEQLYTQTSGAIEPLRAVHLNHLVDAPPGAEGADGGRRSGRTAATVATSLPSVRGWAEMGCLFALIALLSPRLAVFLLWAFTNYVNLAFHGGWFVPLLGLLFAPWTTLFYLLVYAPAGPIHVAGWILVAIGVVIDISSWGQAAANRRSVPYYGG